MIDATIFTSEEAYYEALEDYTSRPSTEAEWDNADAAQRGFERPDQAWVLTDRDVWHRNPFYTGAPQPHPEDYYCDAAFPVVELTAEERRIALADAADYDVPEVDVDDDNDIPF